MNRKRLMLGLLVVMLIFLTTMPASAGSPDTHAKVRIADFAFRPRSVTVHIGDTVRWRNQGAETHTASSTTGEWDSGNLDPGESFDFDFKVPGTFVYRCTIHPFMRGRVIVEE